PVAVKPARIRGARRECETGPSETSIEGEWLARIGVDHRRHDVRLRTQALKQFLGRAPVAKGDHPRAVRSDYLRQRGQIVAHPLALQALVVYNHSRSGHD